MSLTRWKICALVAPVLSLALVASAQAVPVTFEATDNATVQAAGPRTGANGKNFFNLEGSVVGGASFASFGVADFNFATLAPLGGTVSSVSNVVLSLTESNSGFTAAGPFSVYLSTQTSVSIQPANTTLNYVSGQDGINSVDSDLTPLTLLGSGSTTSTGSGGSGTVDTVSLTGSGLSALVSAINSGTTFRLVLTPDASSFAGTWAGFSNATFAGPTLAFDAVVVPEPSTMLLAGFGVVGLGLTLRRKATSIA
jgi:hypothetical protein